eukprot:3382060-Rhodomonas_salina.1
MLFLLRPAVLTRAAVRAACSVSPSRSPSFASASRSLALLLTAGAAAAAAAAAAAGFAHASGRTGEGLCGPMGGSMSLRTRKERCAEEVRPDRSRGTERTRTRTRTRRKKEDGKKRAICGLNMRFWDATVGVCAVCSGVERVLAQSKKVRCGAAQASPEEEEAGWKKESRGF